jgi:large subunit ribosomal protein L4
VLVNDVVLFTEESLRTFLAGPIAVETRKSKAAAAEAPSLTKETDK